MQTVSVILFLVLASANASTYLHPLSSSSYQQESRGRHIPGDPEDGYNDDYFGLFLPKLTPESVPGDEWTFGKDRILLPDRLTKSVGLPGREFSRREPSRYMENPLQEEVRAKRKEASLSIVNMLDVLRQQLFIEQVRRKMEEAKAQIERNRAFLDKAGKRSLQNYEDTVRDVLRRRLQNGEPTAKEPEVDPGYRT